MQTSRDVALAEAIHQSQIIFFRTLLGSSVLIVLSISVSSLLNQKLPTLEGMLSTARLIFLMGGLVSSLFFQEQFAKTLNRSEAKPILLRVIVITSCFYSLLMVFLAANGDKFAPAFILHLTLSMYAQAHLLVSEPTPAQTLPRRALKRSMQPTEGMLILPPQSNTDYIH